MEFRDFDQVYLDRLISGDPLTEQHFVSYFGELILIKVRRRLGQRAGVGVEDIQQETFTRVFRLLRTTEGVRHPERLGALVNSVCNNVLQEAFRSETRHPPLPEEYSDPPDSTVNVEGELITRESQRRVRRVIGEMDEPERQLLQALFLDERERDEVCQRLGVSREYLRVLLHRAKLRFRELYLKTEGSRKLEEVPK